jgi:pimeloyl-ACP methyl ester carboxylesterase
MDYLSMPGARIFYKKLGSSGVPLLFIHGGGCTHSDWEKQLEGLKHGHAVVACDLRGHVQSAETDAASCTLPQMAADVGHMIYMLGLDRPILVGHSYGTRVAILSAIIHPYLTRGVVLVDGSRVFKGTQAQVESSLTEWRDVERRFQRVSDEFLISRLPESERQRIAQSMKSTSAEVLWAITRTSAPWEAHALSAAVAQLDVPLLAIQSTYHDDKTPRYSLSAGESSPYIHLLLNAKPKTEIVVLEGVGHFSMLEAPDQVNEQIERFASKIATM